MPIRVPRVVSLREVAPLLSEIFETEQDVLNLAFDDSEVSVHPSLLCILAAIEHVRPSSVRLLLDSAIGADHQLVQSGMLNLLSEATSTQAATSDPTGRYIPIQYVTDAKTLGNFVTDFVPILHASPETSQAVSYVLHELIRNVLEHAGNSSGAYVCADTSSDGVVRLGVADFGIGVLKTIRRSHAAKDEQQAISLAFQPGISGSSSNFGGDDRNGGAGLFFMKAIAAVSKQPMAMVTGRTVMGFTASQTSAAEVNPSLDDDDVQWTSLSTDFVGTAVGVDLMIGGEQQFEELFSEVRQAYSLSVQAGKKARRRARFT